MSTPTHYATSLSDEQWHVLHLMLPEPKWQPGGPGRPPLDLRRVVDGIFYVNKTGCQWRMMPRDLGNGMTIYGYFRRWRQQGGCGPISWIPFAPGNAASRGEKIIPRPPVPIVKVSR